MTTIFEYYENNPIRPWKSLFEYAKPELVRISEDLKNESFYPEIPDLFNAYKLTPPDKVKVVIMGQDPYHSTVESNGKCVSTAIGLSFSTRREAPVPPSLKNIYKEIKRSYPNFEIPNHGDLTYWAQQGVFMLNKCLTVKPHEAKSHGNKWDSFISKTITMINKVNPRCIYVLWGREAQQFEDKVGKKAIVLKTSHPSPHSCRNGFEGCNHFKMINDELVKQEKSVIDWSLNENTIVNINNDYELNINMGNVKILPRMKLISERNKKIKIFGDDKEYEVYDQDGNVIN